MVWGCRALWVCVVEMQPPSQTTGTAPTRHGPDSRAETSLLHWSAVLVAVCCLVAGGLLLATATFLPAVGAIAAGAALLIGWGSPGPLRIRGRVLPGVAAGSKDHGPVVVPARPAVFERSEPDGVWPGMAAKPAPLAKQRPMPGDPDLYLDLEEVEVQAVYVVGTELFTQLTGGVGERRDPSTGDQRHIETSDVSLTWRCGGGRAADKLAAQLNDWESRHTSLRLLAACGRSALLMEDDQNWLVLPELRLAV